MVARNFVAFDNDSLVVTSSSNGSIVGNGIVNNSDTPDGTVFLYSAGSGVDITVDDTGGGTQRFNDDQPGNHEILDGGGIVANGQDVEAESLIRVRALDINGNQTGPTITLTVFSQNGQFFNVWGFSTSQPLQNGVSYVKVSGSNTGTSRYDSFVTCFCAGTLITTDTAPRAVEDLAIGDRVWTRDNGLQAIRWIGRTRLPAQGQFAPIAFAKGAIGNAAPIAVSPEHRMLIAGPAAALLFGCDDVLVAAKHLCGLPGVHQRHGGMVEYLHIMFDTHQIVEGNGVLSESFFLSDLAVSAVEADQARELLTLFPDLANNMSAYGPTAAPTLKAHEAQVLRAHLQTPNPYALAA